MTTDNLTDIGAAPQPPAWCEPGAQPSWDSVSDDSDMIAFASWCRDFGDDFVEMVTAALNVSDEIRRAEVDSGRESVFRNRVRWAIADNFRAGLLDRPHRDRYMFNREGESLLREHPGPIDRSFQRRRFPKYRDWESGSG